MKLLSSFLLLSLFASGAVFAQTDLQTVATVSLTKTESITGKQLRLDIEAAEKTQGGRALTDEEKRQVLDMKINEILVLQAAERDKIGVTTNEINLQMQQLRNQLAQSIGRQPTEAEFTQALRNQTGMDRAGLEDQFRRQLILQKYIQAKKQNVLDSAKPPTDTEVASYYNLNKAKLVRPETVRFSMIQVPFGTTPAEKSKARETADRLAREIGTNPSKFDEVVQKSFAPNAGYQGGDAGYLPRSQQAQAAVGQELLNTAFTLKQGEVSRLVESPQGYHILKITETYEQKNLGLDDIYQLGTRVTVQNYIRQGLADENALMAIKQATDEIVADLRGPNNRPTFSYRKENIPWWKSTWK
ncbi:MAG: peptidyl-prolyl cis-trans isomerase [Treponema sp.]|nr:peptidyl-prolyl cis-trans isomerase [Treponema sp.]